MVNERLRASLPSSMSRGPPQRGSPRREDTTTWVEPEMGRGKEGGWGASEKLGPKKEPVLHSCGDYQRKPPGGSSLVRGEGGGRGKELRVLSTTEYLEVVVPVQRSWRTGQSQRTKGVPRLDFFARRL